MENSVYDIAVVGAGPAGATLARLIGGQRNVLLIDCKQEGNEGFHKPCGGLLSSDAQRALSHFDLTLPKRLLVDPQIFSVKTIDVVTRRIRHYQRFYLNLDRHAFDLWLRDMAADKTTLYQGACRRIERHGNAFSLFCKDAEGSEIQFFAKKLVGADGANSLVRRTFFPRHSIRSYVAIQQWFEADGAKPFYSCIFDAKTSDCCSWSISKDSHLIFGGAFPAKDCRARFEQQKARLADFGFTFPAPVKTEACLVLRPGSVREICLGGGDVFLLGEAAGFISPSSLEGISWAMDSATALADALSGQSDPRKSYRRNTAKLRLKLALKLLKCPFMYHPFLRELVLRSGLNSIEVCENIRPS